MTAHDPSTRLHVLAIEPWLGGSHLAFLEALRESSRHEIEICGLPARHWKWRMRAGAWDLARRVAECERPDVLLASDYLDLPAFLGFLPASWAGLPVVNYFHENQLTYPLQDAGPKPDTSYGFINLLSCVRADRVVFNSSFHRDEFARAAIKLLGQVPRPRPLEEFQAAIASAAVVAPGVNLDQITVGPGNTDGPLRILFPHRWEHDKNPLEFLQAMLTLRERTDSFELVLLGEQYGQFPPGVADALELLQPNIVHQGFLPTREEYITCLRQCDLVVSTAQHEFFGIAVVEAMAAGAQPLLPNRLSYPEVLGEELGSAALYNSPAEMLERLHAFATDPEPLRAPPSRTRLAERSTIGSQHTTTPLLDAILAEAVG